MPTVADVLKAIERFAPARWALSFDKVGLQAGCRTSQVSKGIVSLDWSNALVDQAIESRSSLIVCHHPLIWEPIMTIDDSTRAGRIALRLIENGIAFIACHTNWDAAPGGVNDSLADALGLIDVSPFGEGARSEQFKLVTFCPKQAAPGILDALAAAGAGSIGDYDRCAFLSEGRGTFRGNENSDPTVGQASQVEEVVETRIEMLVPSNRVSSVVDALLAVHPYEEPAYELNLLRSSTEMPLGRLGELSNSKALETFAQEVDESLSTRCWTWGDTNRPIERVAVCGGAADSVWKDALAANADVLVTGEVKQNIAVDASEAGLAIIAAGHYATEQPGMISLCDRLAVEEPNVEWSVFSPSIGVGGSPI